MKKKNEPGVEVTVKMVVQFVTHFVAAFAGYAILDYGIEHARIPTVIVLFVILGWITVPHIYQLIKELR